MKPEFWRTISDIVPNHSNPKTMLVHNASGDIAF